MPTFTTKSWSIRSRLTAWYALSSLVILAVAGTAAYYAFQSTFIAQTDRSLTIKGMQVISSAVGQELYRRANKFITPKTDPAVVVSNFRTLLSTDATSPVGDPIYLRLLQTDPEKVILLSNNVKQHDFVQRVLRSYIDMPSDDTVQQFFAGSTVYDELRVVDIRVPRQQFVLQLATPWQRDQDALSPLVNIIALVVLFGFALSALGGWVLVGQTLRPISEIVTEAERTTGSRLEPEFVAARTMTDDEIGHLASALNAMMARVHNALNSQRQFTADASHDLRTPLTILRGEIELALNRERSVDEYRSVLRSSLEETERLIRIVSDLGELANADVEREDRCNRKAVNISRLCRDVVVSRRHHADSLNVNLGFTCPHELENAVLPADELALERAIGNLLDNAINYNRAFGTVDLELSMRDSHVFLKVRDTGDGISSDDLPHIFDRFYRGDKSRAMNGSHGFMHSGLGLAIVKSIVDSHDGVVQVESAIGAGSVFTICLPA